MAEAAIANTSDLAAAATQGVAGRQSARALNIGQVNRVLYILAAIAAVYFVIEIILGAVKLAGVSDHIRKLEQSGAQSTASAPANPVKLDLKPVDPALGNRNIFQPSSAQSIVADDASAARVSATYKLVGIAEAQSPSDTYEMVENTQTKLTYFLQYGQPVEGLELEKIIDDKAVVKIGGDSVELK